MTYSHAKIQGQRSGGSEDKVETNGQTDRGDCITFRANAADNNQKTLQMWLRGSMPRKLIGTDHYLPWWPALRTVQYIIHNHGQVVTVTSN